MRLLDQKGKLFGLINPIDLSVLILVLAVLGLGTRILLLQPKKTATAVVTVRLLKVSPEGAASINVGDKVALEITGPIVGKVTDVKIRPAQIESPDDRGRLVASPSRLFKDVDVIIEGKAVVTNRAIKMAGVEVKAEMRRILSGIGYEIQGQIVNVSLR